MYALNLLDTNTPQPTIVCLVKEGPVINKPGITQDMPVWKNDFIVCPTNPRIVTTALGDLSISSNAVVLLAESVDHSIVYVLSQTRPKQVSFSLGNQQVFVESGCALINLKEKR